MYVSVSECPLLSEGTYLTLLPSLNVKSNHPKGIERSGGLCIYSFQFGSVAHSLRPHGLQHGRPPCPSPTPKSLLKLMSIESVMPFNHLILCHPLLPPSILPSIRVFSNESVFPIRWPKNWSFSFGISSSKEHPGLISFRVDWLDLLAVQGTLKSLLHTTVQKHQFFSTQPEARSPSTTKNNTCIQF